MFTNCGNKGGEVIVKRDNDGCVMFTECVTRGNSRDAYVTEDEITDIPDSSELLSLAFKLEKLKIDFDKLARQADDIAAYYSSTGSNDAKRYERVADMFEAINDKIDDLKDKMRQRLDSISRNDIVEIKHDLKYIKDVMLKDVLYLMLSSGDEIDDIVSNKESDCGTDGQCFNDALRICKSILFRPEGSKGPTVKITGLENGKCILVVEHTTPVGNADMTCKIEKYALGIRDPETDLLPHCEGKLMDLMKTYGTQEPKQGPSRPVERPEGESEGELMGCDKVRLGINEAGVCRNGCCEPNADESYQTCPEDCMHPEQIEE